ncbi:MAG: hypothetical protein ACRDJC_07060 [Thermomicrobiales bacterium]
MVETDIIERNALQERVMLHEPEGGWSREAYEQALAAYVAAHGRPPQTVTMHPETAAQLGLSEELADITRTHDAPLLVTAAAYERQTIVWYY